MPNTYPKIKILRPYFLSEKEHWVIVYKYLDDPETEPWKLISHNEYFMFSMVKQVIYMLEKYTLNHIAFEYLDIDEFDLMPVITDPTTPAKILTHNN
jgi:hypothetical protein